MSRLITIIFLLIFNAIYGQKSFYINGTIVDETGKPIVNAQFSYGDSIHSIEHTVYSNKKGQFQLVYGSPQFNWCYFKIKRKDFLPKSIFHEITSNRMVLLEPIILRSRKGFWYDPKQIDSADIGITVKEAIMKFKLDIDMCILSSEPPGKYHHFMTELSDSSYIYFTFKGVYSKEKGVMMTDILDKQITGIGISFIDGSNKIFGDGLIHGNPYIIERRMKMTPK